MGSLEQCGRQPEPQRSEADRPRPDSLRFLDGLPTSNFPELRYTPYVKRTMADRRSQVTTTDGLPAQAGQPSTRPAGYLRPSPEGHAIAMSARLQQAQETGGSPALQAAFESAYPDPAVRALAERFALSHNRLGFAAQSRNLKREALRAQLVTKLARVAAHPTAIRVRPQSLPTILATGRFVSVREARTKNPIGLPVRDAVESTLYARPIGADPRHDIIYGYIAAGGEWPVGQFAPGDGGTTDLLTQYGEAVEVLKRDLDARTTFCVGDTFADPKAAIPCLKNDVRWHAFGMYPDKPWHPLSTIWEDFDDPAFYSATYAEAQIHGGVTVADIDYVALLNKPGQLLTAALENAGVRWKTLNYEEISLQDDPRLHAKAVRRLTLELNYVCTTWPGFDQARQLKQTLREQIELISPGTLPTEPEEPSPPSSVTAGQQTADLVAGKLADARKEVRQELKNLERRLVAKAFLLNPGQVTHHGAEQYGESVRKLLAPKINALLATVDTLTAAGSFDPVAYEAWHTGVFKSHIDLQSGDGTVRELTFIDRGFDAEGNRLHPIMTRTESAEHKLVLIKLLAQWDRDPDAIMEVVTRRLHSGTAAPAQDPVGALLAGYLEQDAAARRMRGS